MREEEAETMNFCSWTQNMPHSMRYKNGKNTVGKVIYKAWQQKECLREYSGADQMAEIKTEDQGKDDSSGWSWVGSGQKESTSPSRVVTLRITMRGLTYSVKEFSDYS